MLMQYLICAIAVFAYMSVFWGISQKLNKVAIIDIAWGFGFSLVTVISILLNFPPNGIVWIISIPVFIWSLRLGTYVLMRSKGKPEDWRYESIKSKWKNPRISSFFGVFMFQGVLMLFIAYPIIINNLLKPKIIGFLTYVGIIIWIIGFLFESLADYQLRKFLKIRKPGQIMKKGLWKYSRHPNYFGEVLIWLGIALIGFSSSKDVIVFGSPILLAVLLLFVSGVPLIEKKYKDNKEFQNYKKKTSMFIPWPPKK